MLAIYESMKLKNKLRRINITEMHNYKSYLILSLLVFWLPSSLLKATVAATGSLAVPPELVINETGIARIGVILGQASRPGKETKVSIEIAIQDFNIKANRSSVLYLQNSLNKPSRAAFAAKELIDEHGVNVILGGHTWEEASAIAEVISEEADHDHSPLFLSLADMTPPQATDQWPFLVQAVPSQSTQMNAVAAVLQTWGIRQVTLIYETSHLASSIISHLSQAFLQTGCELTLILPFSPGSSCFVNKELQVLKTQKRQVFIIHTSLQLGICLFQTAKKMEMTGDGYLWIATNEITDLFHSINSTMISSLKGMVGVKTYFPESTPDFQDFRKRFRQKFGSDYPEEEQDEPGIFAVQGYNAMKLLEKNSPENLHHRRPIPVTTVEIVSVIGRKGYHSVYWTKGLGFSETVDGATNYTDDVGQALWPVQPWYAHSRRHRNLAESSKNPMRVGIPNGSLFEQFVKVEFDHDKNEHNFSGFVIAVFDEMMGKMNQPFKYELFNGSYKDLIKAIPEKRFDAVAGDVIILSERHKSVDYTQPFTESGLQMIVPVRSRNHAWLFLKPFTAEMWWLIAAITIYNGFIIWLIERKYSEDLRGSGITQIGIIFWLAFTTLFTLRGDKLHSNLSRMAMVIWLFVALIVTQSYTASLASMLTAQRLEPAISSVEMLKNMNATVGYCNGSFSNHYLKDVLLFEKVKSYSSTHRSAKALNSGEIAAIFLEVPVAKVFLAQYCKSFIKTRETFKVGGFGFAFYKGFPRMSDANKALIHLTESGKLKELEDKFLISEKCVDEDISSNEESRLSPRSFSVLFELTGGASTIALAIYIIIIIRDFRNSTQEDTSFIKLISAFIKDWQHRMRRSSSAVVNIENPRRT